MNTGEPDPSCMVNRRRRPGGFTLMELVVAMFMTTVLLVGMGSVMLMAMHATPKAQGPMIRTLEATRIADQIAAELYGAVSVIQASATVVEFTVADRNNDTVPETIRYQWSGTPGDPLQRQYNGGTPVTIVEEAQEFALTYTTRIVTTTEATNEVTVSDEVLFATFDGWPGNPGTTGYFVVSPVEWAAEFFEVDQVVLPPTTSEITITRAKVKLKTGTSGSTVSVGIHRSKGGGNPEPRNAPLGTPVVAIAPVPPSQWVEVSFTDVSLKQLNKEFVVVVKGTGSGSVDVEKRYWSGAPKDVARMIWTLDGGASWDPKKNEQDDTDMPFAVWGTYETTETVTTQAASNIIGMIGITLRTGADPSTLVDTAVQVLNGPELPGP